MNTLESFFSKAIGIEKWHGASNDFLFLSLHDLKSACTTSLSSELWRESVVALCQRNTGLGADGVVVWDYNPVRTETIAAIWNSDGSRAQTCGNALRCFAGLLLEKKIWDGTLPINIHSLEENEGEPTSVKKVFARLISASLEKNTGEFRATVGMGSVSVHRSLLCAGKSPSSDPNSIPEWMQSVESLTFVQLANPHLIVQLVPGGFSRFDRSQFCEMGSYFQSEKICHGLGIPLSNIGFLEPDPQNKNTSILNAIVYERGVGLTQCCGSGGCAMRVALSEDHRTPMPEQLFLKMPGGVITVSEDKEELILTGPARKIGHLQAIF